MKRLRRLLRGKESARYAEAVQLADFQDVRPVGNMRGRLITNKNGRAILRARYHRRDVKIYEAHSEQHARFIAAFSAKMPDIFPEIVELRGAWVVAEWVEGSPLARKDRVDTLAILRRIQSVPTSELPPAGFCYWNDFLLPRFLRAATLAGKPDLANGMSGIFSGEDTSVIVPTVMHPDMSPDNLIATADGRLVSIDNELLSVGTLPLLDLCNFVRPLDRKERDRMAALWRGEECFSAELLERLARAWLVREIGSAFIAGRFARCQSLLTQIDNADSAAVLPFAL